MKSNNSIFSREKNCMEIHQCQNDANDAVKETVSVVLWQLEEFEI